MEDEEEDVSWYWMTLRYWKWKEDALDLLICKLASGVVTNL